MIIGYKAFGFGLLELQKSDEHEHAPPEPWIKQRLSWITVHDRTTPLSNFGDLGWDNKNKNYQFWAPIATQCLITCVSQPLRHPFS